MDCPLAINTADRDYYSGLTYFFTAVNIQHMHSIYYSLLPSFIVGCLKEEVVEVQTTGLFSHHHFERDFALLLVGNGISHALEYHRRLSIS